MNENQLTNTTTDRQTWKKEPAKNIKRLKWFVKVRLRSAFPWATWHTRHGCTHITFVVTPPRHGNVSATLMEELTCRKIHHRPGKHKVNETAKASCFRHDRAYLILSKYDKYKKQPTRKQFQFKQDQISYNGSGNWKTAWLQLHGHPAKLRFSTNYTYQDKQSLGNHVCTHMWCERK